MTVSILSISARERGGIAVCFELAEGEHRQKETLVIGPNSVADLGLKTGECSKELFDAVSEHSQVYFATKKGLDVLGYGACSKKMLMRKLSMKGFSQCTVKRATEELVKSGYLDPQADAAREAEKCVSKLWGKRRIAAELFKKGYSEEDVKSAFYALEDAELDFAEVCAERIRRTVRELPGDPMQRRKLVASLERYGFSSSEIREAIKLAFEE